jgi:hypothetical protein
LKRKARKQGEKSGNWGAARSHGNSTNRIQAMPESSSSFLLISPDPDLLG